MSPSSPSSRRSGARGFLAARRLTIACAAAALAMSGAITSPVFAVDQVDGKDLLYRTHVDAAHVSFKDGVLDVVVIDGQNPRPADDVAVRLGPDANADGTEVSRIAVPSGSEWSFLGKPGDIVWHAPQQMYANWAPVWPGIGAGEMPSTIDPNSISLELVDDGGPGDVEVYRTDYAGRPQRTLSSAPGSDEDLHSARLRPRAHGHYNWAFTEPGVYNMTWRAHARTTSGEELTSPDRTVTWYVGEDKDVNLPEGSYKGTPITTPVTGGTTEPAPEQPSPEVPSPEAPAPTEPVTPTPTIEAPADNPTKKSWNPDPAASACTHIDAGHVDIRARYAEGTVANVLRWDSPSGEVMDLKSRKFVLEVPDSAIQMIPAEGATKELSAVLKTQTAYYLPEIQQDDLPWVGFSTEDLNVPEGSTVTLNLMSMGLPSSTARYAMGYFDISKQQFVVEIDSTNRKFQTVPIPPHTHTHKGQFFTEPGYYTLYYSVTVTLPDGTQSYGTLDAWYAVGTQAIAWSCEREGVLPEAPVEETPIEDDPVEDAPVDEAPINEAPVDEAPVEETPVDEAPIDEAPVDETPVDETPVNEAPVDEAPVDEAPVDEAPVDEAPVDETPVDEAPVDEASIDNSPADEKPANDSPVNDAPVGNAPADESPINEGPVDEKPADETPREEDPAEEPSEDAEESVTNGEKINGDDGQQIVTPTISGGNSGSGTGGMPSSGSGAGSSSPKSLPRTGAEITLMAAFGAATVAAGAAATRAARRSR